MHRGGSVRRPDSSPRQGDCPSRCEAGEHLADRGWAGEGGGLRHRACPKGCGWHLPERADSEGLSAWDAGVHVAGADTRTAGGRVERRVSGGCAAPRDAHRAALCGHGGIDAASARDGGDQRDAVPGAAVRVAGGGGLRARA